MARILVVEDNPGNLKLARLILEAAGYEVSTACDAEAGIELAKSLTPDVILMDIQMPGLDGYQALAALKEMPSTARVPVIATTAHAMKGDSEKMLSSGFDGYICKPFRYRDFLDAVSRMLGEAEGG